jgi:hypothetical protein
MPTPPAGAIGVDKDAPPAGSIAHTYRANGVHVTKAINNRLAGVALVSDKLRVRDDGFPRLIITSNCRNLIRTLPELVRDDKRPEDVDTHGEDHAYDALRYLLMLLEGMPEAGAGHREAARRVAAGEARPSAGRTETGDLLNREL